MRFSEITTIPLYGSRPVLNGAAIVAWAQRQGFPNILAPSDLHVTVAYSRNPVDPSTIRSHSNRMVVKDDARSLARFGDTLVLLIDHADLHTRWRGLCEMGCSWDHDGYKPHVSITYDGADFDLSKVEPYRGPIILGPEKFERLDEDAHAPAPMLVE